MIRYTLALAIVMMAIPAIAQTKAAPAAGTTNMDILRQKIKSDKKLVVAQNLNLTDAEGAKFWPGMTHTRRTCSRLTSNWSLLSRRMPTPITRDP